MMTGEKSNKTTAMPRLYWALGLMSGTAIDGVDAAIIETDGQGHVRPLGFASVPYDDGLRARIRTHFGAMHDVRGEIAALAHDLTAVNAAAIVACLARAGLQADELSVIGFHGQTITHKPDQKFTWQIGDPTYLVRMFGVPVVFNFRVDDVAAGGQGAPLLPIYHHALAQGAGWPLPAAILNIGGVANITFIGAAEKDLIAFDTGPGNALIDDFVRTRTGQSYDAGGEMALRGRAHQALVQNVMDHPYFSAPPPKSLDRNAFAGGVAGVDALSTEDGAATLAMLTATSIAHGVDQLPTRPHRIWVAGGGRHNRAILRFLEQQTGIEVCNIDTAHLDGQAIEAQGFAYMAARRLENLPISFPGTTGVPAPMLGGILYRPL